MPWLPKVWRLTLSSLRDSSVQRHEGCLLAGVAWLNSHSSNTEAYVVCDLCPDHSIRRLRLKLTMPPPASIASACPSVHSEGHVSQPNPRARLSQLTIAFL